MKAGRAIVLLCAVVMLLGGQLLGSPSTAEGSHDEERRCIYPALIDLVVHEGDPCDAEMMRRIRATLGPRLIVYGDSLAYEAAPYIRRILRDVALPDAKVLAVGGMATCDFLGDIVRDAARYRPAAVVIQFSGNAFTPCMQDQRGEPLRDEAWLTKYRADTIRAVEAFRTTGTQVWLATAPVSRFGEMSGNDNVKLLAAMYRDVAERFPYARVTDAAQSVLSDGRWTLTLPCLPREPCMGGIDLEGRLVNQVRSPDGGHFCPVTYPLFGTCPAHASGGLRYALGMIVPALRDLGVLDEARFAGSIGAGWRG